MKEAIKGLTIFAVVVVGICIGAFAVLSTIHIAFYVWGPLP